MEIASLAAKQKRIKDWHEFAQAEIRDPALKSQLDEQLRLFKGVLLKCWQEGKVSSDSEKQINDLERRLEQMNEEARLRVLKC